MEMVPFDENPFYKRFVERELGPSEKVVSEGRTYSPVTPVCGEPEGVEYHAGDDCDERAHGQDSVYERRRNSGEASPVLFTRRPVDEGLESFRVSRDMLSSFHREIEEMFLKEIGGLRTSLLKRLETLESNDANMTAQLSELRVVGSSIRSGVCPQSRSTPLAKYEAKLDSSTPHGDWVIDVESICKTLRMNLPYAIVGIAEERGDVIDNVSIAVRAILFGLLPSQKRVAFSTGVGRRHNAFRFSVVLNILCNAQRNRFGRFGDCGSPGEAERPAPNAAGGADRVLRIRQPEWLNIGYVRQKHVEEARRRLESNVAALEMNDQDTAAASRQKTSWITVKDNPDKADIAKYGALKVYRFVSAGLYHAREKTRWMLFEELTYLMVPWAQDDGDVDQNTLKCVWEYMACDISVVDIRGVPQCKKRSGDPVYADEHNVNVFSECLSAHKEMVLCVSHKVKIRPGGTSLRQRRCIEERTLKRAINLIDVAAKFCVVFTEQAMGGFSHLPFLGTHPNSVRCIYAVAVLLRRVVETFMQEYLVDGAFCMPDGEGPPAVECPGIKFDNLLPAASVRKRLLSARCLRMTSDEYEKIDATSGTGMGYRPIEDDAEDDGDIDPEDVEGVMLL